MGGAGGARRRRTTRRQRRLPCAGSAALRLSGVSRPMKVAVVGAAGYAGGELLRLLLQHPEVTECVATSRSQAGKPIAEVHPALGRRSPTRASPARRRARSRAGATSSSSASSTASRRASPARSSTRARASSSTSRRISGCATPSSTSGSTDRTPRPSCCHRFTYGLADVRGLPASAAPAAIAAPGCFATAAQLALYPLAWAGLDVTPSLFAITGSSGAGVQPRPTTHHPMRAHNVFAYSVLGHRHEAEVLAVLAGMGGPPRRHRPAHDALGPVRARHLSHAARVRAAEMRHPRRRAGTPRPRAGSARRTRAARSSACSTRRPSSPMPWAPTTR